MSQRYSRDEETYELRDNTGLRHPDDFDYASSFEEDGARAGLLGDEQNAYPSRPSLIESLINLLHLRRRRAVGKHAARSRRQRNCLKPSSLRRVVILVFAALTTIILFECLLFPSYTNPPPHYAELRNRAQEVDTPGRANPKGQKVFIAASIFDKHGELARGAWGESILGLVDVLGPTNVFLSIYENDAGQEAEAALQEFRKRVTCDQAITFEKHLSLDEVPHVKLPDGSDRVKRIAYLSEVRNRALKPLQESQVRYDKLLYINDVVFDPIEAAQLLFSTHVDDQGQAEYRAACAVDFINPFKYYDTFATRDYEGYGIGVPFFPWFTSAGAGVSKRDVLAGSDAVRVKSCWGGMVAFDAQYFQSPSIVVDIPSTAGSEGPSNMSVPYEFRAEDDLYWDASECCLIHADIQDVDPSNSGVFMNPFVRVAYDARTLSWLSFTRRFERLYTPIHYLLSKAVGMPWYNPRRDEQAGERVKERVWLPEPGSPSGGSFQEVERTATHSGFCGRKALQVLKTDITSEGKNWEFLPVPE